MLQSSLGVMDRVGLVSAYSTNSCAQKLVSCGKTAPDALSLNTSFLQTKVAPFTDAAIVSGSYTNAPSSIAFSAASDPGTPSCC